MSPWEYVALTVPVIFVGIRRSLLFLSTTPFHTLFYFLPRDKESYIMIGMRKVFMPLPMSVCWSCQLPQPNLILRSQEQHSNRTKLTSMLDLAGQV